ncbi:MAG: MerR family transcriptional regulator [Planctomycetes bacterium]|nr:MerR family transcriptional regulator [Planctomycetota bacterium]
MSGSADHHRLRSIGKILQEEQSRFIGYPEIERKSRELGFGMSVRTLRFYVDEGILPAPRKVGKTPVYEEEWILNVLLSIHLMKTRFNRSLTEIRQILQTMSESPEILADKLSVLYEDVTKSEELQLVERAALQDAFFALLTGKLVSGKSGQSLQASELRLSTLVELFQEQGKLDGEDYQAPEFSEVLASQGYGTSATPTVAARPSLEDPSKPASESATALTPTSIPSDAVTIRMARAKEIAFAQRFKVKFERLGRVHCPIDGKGYKAGPREHAYDKDDRSSEVVDTMKSMRIYDRALLDSLPLGEVREFRVFQRGLFGRGDLKVVVRAVVLSPVEDYLRQRWSNKRLGALEAKRAVEELDLKEGVFHYVGILSTSGWDLTGTEQIPTRPNLLACLVESQGEGSWRVHLVPDDRWGGVEVVFDPETEEEKVERVRIKIEHQVRPKGEFVIISNLCEDLDVPRSLVQDAIDQLLDADSELTLLDRGGREILKRSRL